MEPTMNYFPPWWYPPQQQRERGLSQKDIERAVRRAIQLKDYDKKEKRKRREDMQKKASAAKAKFFTNLEWYILGILMYPIVGPLYHIVINHMNAMVK